MAYPFTEAWSHNFEQELEFLASVIRRHPLISIDTEFPGHVIPTPRYENELIRYDNMKFNIDNSKIVQLGVTLSNFDGIIHWSWVFNFHFNLEEESLCNYNPDSIRFLKENGMDFERLATQGIRIEEFAYRFSRIIFGYPYLKWITFHGLYDFGYMMRMLLNEQPLPNTLDEFLLLAGSFFGDVFDVKYMASICEGLCYGDLGLARLANLLVVERVGQQHDAGSDSLLVSRTFLKIIDVYGEGPYVTSLGRLYSICTPILRC